MCVLNKDLFFHTVDYSILMNFNNSGGVSGVFRPLTNYSYKQEYRYKGCYFIAERDVINLAFTIDWGASTDSEDDFTCFSGQIINQNMLILDWILINRKKENNYVVSGSSFLYSASYIHRKEKATETVRPFPINIKLLVEN